jgi:outer membrane protein insertion porin family
MNSLLILLLALPSEAVSEGEIISAVRLEAPERDRQRLMRYMEISAGDPVSAERIAHMVEVVYATGEFANVVVEASRPPEGLELVFRPIPVPLLRTLRVVGDAQLKPSKVRKITRLRVGERLWKRRLDRAAQDVALSLSAEGYLEAQVSAVAEGPPEGADAVFTVTAGPRARVGSLSIVGVAASGEFESLARPRVLEPFERSKAESSRDKMRKRLQGQGRWQATVELREAYDPSSARVALTFEIQPGPTILAEFEGFPVPGSLRRSLEGVLREGGLKSDAVEETTERLEEALLSQGYRDAAVSHREEDRSHERVVHFEIRPGAKAEVARVQILGEGVPRTPLLTRPGRPLEDRLIDEDTRALTRALEDAGYSEAKVDAEVPEGGGSLNVVFRVHAGPRTVVRSYDVETKTPLPKDSKPKERHVRVGEPYRVRDLARDRNELVSAYRNAGYLRVEVTPEVSLSEDKTEAEVKLRVQAGTETKVDRVVIAGLQKTKERVVRRELQIHEGDPLGLEKVLESQRRLGALGIFQRVDVTEMDPESEKERSLVVNLEETPSTTRVAYGIGYTERELLGGSVQVTLSNLSGLDRTLTTLVRASFKGNRLLASYRAPYVFGKKEELFTTAFREEEDRDSFSFVRLGGSLSTNRLVTPHLNLIGSYIFERTTVFNILVPLDELDRQFRDSTFSGPATSAVHDTRDDALDPNRGHFLLADVRVSLKPLGGDSFVRGFFEASGYRRLIPRVLLAVSGRVGLARTFGGGVPLGLPLPDRFFAGGDYSLRGFKIDSVGPQALSSAGGLLPTGGNALLLGGAEFRVDVGGHFSVATFTDVGNVYPLVSNMTLSDLRYAVGVGLRYKSPFGPLRIDYGYKLNRRLGESPGHLHFTVGHAF